MYEFSAAAFPLLTLTTLNGTAMSNRPPTTMTQPSQRRRGLPSTGALTAAAKLTTMRVAANTSTKPSAHTSNASAL